MLPERFADFLYRRRRLLFVAWWLHVFVIHAVWLGMMSWDGFAYRTQPVIELLQHGSLGTAKYADWSLRGNVPFVELAHLPFLAVLGLRGLFIGFPLVVFPLCVRAVFRLMHELTDDPRAATFGAMAYAALPMMNQQPFAAYVDFAVVGALAYYVFALRRMVREDEPWRRRFARLAFATFLFTMARSQGVYVVVVITPLLGAALCCARDGWRVKLAHRRAAVIALAAVALGCLPAIGVQIYRYVEFGSPVAPMQFKILGLKTAAGTPLEVYYRYARIDGHSAAGLARTFYENWIWHADWPISAFYGGQHMAAGLLFVLALALLPVFVRRASGFELTLVGVGVLVALLSKDFVLPRWSYTTTLSTVIILGRGLPGLLAGRLGRRLYWVAVPLLLLHFLRPELDIAQVRTGYVSQRMNVMGSRWFLKGKGPNLVRIYPDAPARQFYILGENTFPLPIFGRHLRNEVLGTIPAASAGPGCAGLQPYLDRHPGALFIDETEVARDCQRTCVIHFPVGASPCAGWAITPARIAPPGRLE